ncbi:MAG: hypothetical protein UV05_C0011G0026 [candidate division CPR1 bacterium GW2011_GWA2_42_17]|uniref:HicB-like antitoxin of toxin-antitoxin system domain-containing protein n=1 Tax=candidate division CPR1 bacterium GW2011_GWA2_42_17 TaxID=1618341 RepID=A0A0G0Z633_9BACT|nr:MAG: hypothetical protein UV05_C0011G0026 [candidate division CPR1 bacterium GW2011_GWA2_42_17]
MSQTFSFRVIIEPDKPSGFHGFVPALKGLHTCGETLEEVKTNLSEAIRCHLEGLIKDELPLPSEDGTIELIQMAAVPQFLVIPKKKSKKAR